MRLLVIMTWAIFIECSHRFNLADNRSEDSIYSEFFYYPVSEIICPYLTKYKISPITLVQSKNCSIVEPSEVPSAIVLVKSTGMLAVDNFGRLDREYLVVVEDEYRNKASISIKLFKDAPYAKGIKYGLYSVKDSLCPINEIEIIENVSGIIPNVNISQFGNDENIFKSLFHQIEEKKYKLMLLNISGYLYLNKSEYTFYFRSSYNGIFTINNTEIINNGYECLGFEKEYNNTYSVNKTDYYPFSLLVYIGEKDVKGNGGWKFSIEYKTSEESYDEKKSIEPLLESYSRSIPLDADLVIEKHIYSVRVGVMTKIPFIYENPIKNCIVEPLLPYGSYISLYSNTINLYSEKEMYNEYKIKCFNFYTQSNTRELKIYFTNDYSSGLVGYYMKSDNFPTNLTVPMDMKDGVNVHINTLMIENKINEIFTESDIIWNGLSSKFYSEYGSHYGEYISIEESKEYKFKMSCKDACWMRIDGDLILSIVGDSKGKYRSVTDSIYIEKGIHIFDLDYLHYTGGKGLEIFIWNEKDEIWEYPSSYLKYIQPGYFAYKFVKNVYIKDEAIATNSPVLFGIDEKDISHYSIMRELPNGLEFNNKTGEIYGKPSEASPELFYRLLCYLSNSSLSYETEITIKVENISIPSGIYLMDIETSIIYNNEINLTIGYPISLKIDSSGPTVAKYEVTKICDGLEYDSKDSTIKGNVKDDKNCEILVIASNVAGKTTKVFKVKLNDMCVLENEHLGYFELLNVEYQTTAMLLDKNDRVVFSETGLSPKWNKVVCLVENRYKFIVNMNNSNDYSLAAKCDGGVIAKKKIKSEFYYLIDLEMNIYPPELIYPSEITVEQFEYISIKPEIIHPTSMEFIGFGGIDRLTLNEDTGEISGYILSKPTSKILSFAVFNGFGRIEKKIQFNIIENTCERNGKVLLRIEINPTIKPFNMYFNMKDKNQNMIFSINGSELEPLKQRNYSRCINEGIYEVNYGSNSDEFDDWNFGTVNVFQNDAIMGRYVIDYNKNSEVEYENIASLQYKSHRTSKLYLYYWISYFSEWQYSTEYEENWNKPEKKVDWSKSKLSDTKVDSNVLYLRIEHSKPDNSDDFTSFYSKMKVLSGIKYFINGKEEFRYFIDEDKDISLDKFTELQEMKFLFPYEVFDDNGIVIGIELHRDKNESNFPSFEYTGFPLQGDDVNDCTPLNQFGINVFYENPYHSYNSYVVFQDSYEYYKGYFEEGYYDTFSNTTFNNFSYFSFNTLSVIGSPCFANCRETPDIYQIDIENKNGNMTNYINYKFPFFEISNIHYKHLNTKYSEITNKINVYIANHFQIWEYALYLIQFSMCRVFKCSNTYPTDSYYPYTCPEDKIKKGVLHCPFGKNPHFEGELPCSEGFEENEYKLDNYTFIIGEKEGNVQFYQDYLKNRKTTVTPELPPCIKQVGLGIYRCECVSEYPMKEYTFKYGNNTHKMRIEVKLPNHPFIIIKRYDATFIVQQESEPVELFDVFGDDYDIFVSPKLPYGIELVKNRSVSIKGKPYSNGITQHLISFITPTYSRQITIKINVTVSKIPILIDSVGNYSFIYGANYSDLSLFHIVKVYDLFYSVEPELPKSLQLNKFSGKISGQVTETPSSFQPKLYNFIVKNNQLIIPITLSIVESEKPVVLDYESEKEVTIGLDVELKLFTVLGKEIEYSVSPELPTGLELSKITGIISGKITEKVNDKIYTFMFRNDKGNSYISILLKFNYPLIPKIVKSEKEKTFYKNVPVNSYSLFTAIGENLKYECKEQLPSGLLLLESSGVIVGTPNRKSEKKEFEFKVSNENGFDTIKISIEIDIMYCESDNSKWSKCEILNKCYMKCEGIKNGNYERECDLNKNNEAEWLEEINGCEINSTVLIAIIIPCVFCLLLLSLIIIFIIYRRHAVLRVNEDKKKSLEGKIKSNIGINPIMM